MPEARATGAGAGAKLLSDSERKEGNSWAGVKSDFFKDMSSLI